jgi:hypothetical protein
MTDNNIDPRSHRISVESISPLSFKDRFASSFMMSAANTIRSQPVPKIVQIDEVFEINSEELEHAESVNLTLWRSRDDFEASYFKRSESLYDGFGVNPK